MSDQHQRARWHNYHEPGIYLITMVAEHRGSPFGNLERLPDDGRVVVKLTPLGQAVERQLHNLPAHAEGLVVLRTMVMPDHIHVVVEVRRPLKRHLGALVRGFKYGTTVEYLRDLDARYGGIHRVQDSRPSADQREAAKAADQPPFTQPPSSSHQFSSPTPSASPSSSPSSPLPSSHPSVSPVGGGLSASISPASFISVPPLWADGYHDRILYGRGQLSRMLHYVSDNPRRGWIKQQHRDLFYNKRMIDIPLSIEQARWLLREARSLGVMQELQDVLIVEQRLSDDASWQPLSWWQSGAHADPRAAIRAVLRMKMMGNHFLLDEALLLPVRISRSIKPNELEKKKAELLERCECEGAVVITPAVSLGEENVMGVTLNAGYNVIRLMAHAMSDVWAPAESLLHHTSRGQLLFLAPWPQRPQGSHPHKGIFELLNLICRLLASR